MRRFRGRSPPAALSFLTRQDGRAVQLAEQRIDNMPRRIAGEAGVQQEMAIHSDLCAFLQAISQFHPVRGFEARRYRHGTDTE